MSIDFTKMDQETVKGLAAEALSHIKEPENGIGKATFDAIMKVSPQVAIETVIVDDVDNPTQIFLTWREDKHYKGWHCAGSFMRFGKSFKQTVVDILRREHEAEVEDVKETGVTYNRVDSRGQTIGIVFLVKSNIPMDQNTSTKRWFSSIPSNTLPHHVDFLKRALGWK